MRASPTSIELAPRWQPPLEECALLPRSTSYLAAVTGNPFEEDLYLCSHPENRGVANFVEVDPLEIHITSQEERIKELNHTAYFGASLVGMSAKWEEDVALHGQGSVEAVISSTRLKLAAQDIQQGLPGLFEDRHTLDAVNAYPLPDHLKYRITRGGTVSIAQGISEAKPEALVQFAKWNKEYIAVRCEEQRPVLEALRAEFRSRIDVAIAQQGLPANRDRVMKKLDRVALAFIDPLLLTKDIGGEFRSPRELAVIKLTLDPQYMRELVYHELMHAVSGREKYVTGFRIHGSDTLTAEQERVDAMNGGYAHDSRVGLRVWGYNGAGEQKDLYRWLNEAMTEQLAQILLLHPGCVQFIPPGNPNKVPKRVRSHTDPFRAELRPVGVYIPFRGLAEAVINLSDATVYDATAAYFEDNIPGKPGMAKSPKQRAFHKGFSSIGYMLPALTVVEENDAYQLAMEVRRLDPNADAPLGELLTYC